VSARRVCDLCNSTLSSSDAAAESSHTSLRAMAMVERAPGSVEAMKHVLSYLVAERQQLRANGGSAVELEANRKAIAAMEWQLDHALRVARLTA
jgi:hypothetical protein